MYRGLSMLKRISKIISNYKLKLYLYKFYIKGKNMLLTQFSTQLQSRVCKLVNKKSDYKQDISELLLIQQQTDLMNQIIKNQANSKKINTMSTQLSDFSLDAVESSHHLNFSFSQIGFGIGKQHSKFFEEQSLELALNQIRKLCSRKTYNFVRDKFKTTEQNRKNYRLEKQIKYNQELMRRCLKLNHQVTILKTKLEETSKNKLQQKKTSKQIINIQKGEAFLKWQKAMIYKEKLHAETKKNLNKQFSILEIQKKQNELVRDDIQMILLKIKQIGFAKNQETKQILQMVQGNLMQQKKLSKQQEQDYKKYQNQIESILKQLKGTIGLQQ